MFGIDDKFLEEIGIANMPEPARGQLVEGIQQTIQDRVLIQLADQINEFLTDELEQINSSPEFAEHWLKKNLPHYAGSSDYKQFAENIPAENVTQLYAQTKWFEMNLPTYPATVAQVIDDVKQELKTINGK
jgi:hypothetical protein